MDVVLWPHHLLATEAIPVVAVRLLMEETGPHNPIYLLNPFVHPSQVTDTAWHRTAITLV